MSMPCKPNPSVARAGRIAVLLPRAAWKLTTVAIIAGTSRGH